MIAHQANSGLKLCAHCDALAEAAGFIGWTCRDCIRKKARERQRLYDQRPEVIARKKTPEHRTMCRKTKRIYIKKESYRAKQRDYEKSERGQAARLRVVENGKAWRTANPMHPKTIAFKLRNRITLSLLRSLKNKKNGGWLKYVDYTLDELRSHLERQFLPGMGWHNMGEWHIDHIIPVSSFNLLESAQVARCWALPNLRPLWAQENKKKHARVETLL